MDLLVDVNGLYGVDKAYDSSDYNSRCDYAAPLRTRAAVLARLLLFCNTLTHTERCCFALSRSVRSLLSLWLPVPCHAGHGHRRSSPVGLWLRGHTA